MSASVMDRKPGFQRPSWANSDSYFWNKIWNEAVLEEDQPSQGAMLQQLKSLISLRLYTYMEAVIQIQLPLTRGKGSSMDH